MWSCTLVDAGFIQVVSGRKENNCQTFHLLWPPLQNGAAERTIWSSSLCVPSLLLLQLIHLLLFSGSFGSQMKTCSMDVACIFITSELMFCLPQIILQDFIDLQQACCVRVCVCEVVCIQEDIWTTQSTFSLDPTRQINCFLILYFLTKQSKHVH